MALELKLVENDVTSFQKPMEQHMEAPLKHFEVELLKIRTGRAHTSLIEDIMVVCYAQPPAPLKNYAALAAPEARLLTIQPWDKTIIPDIEKAITNSELGLTPRNDGNLIRIQLPEVSGDRREALVKTLHKKLEEARVSIRNIRKDFNNLLRDAKKDKEISENFFNRLEDTLQKVTDKYIAKVEELSKKKEKDITTV